MELTWLAIYLRLRIFVRGDQSRTSIRLPVNIQIAVTVLEMYDTTRALAHVRLQYAFRYRYSKLSGYGRRKA
jgi:hypothetical protein